MPTNAERQKRYRRHKAGDHRLCLERNCTSAGQTPDPVEMPETAELEPVARGATLWTDLAGDSLPPSTRVLLEEACRIADRLDNLHRLLTGTAADWLALVEDKGDPERQIVVIDRPLAEARQQALALKALIAEIRAAGATKPGTVRPPSAEGVAGVTNLATWAPARSSKATG